MNQSWIQTIALMLTIAVTAAAMALWIQGLQNDVVLTLSASAHRQDVLEEKVDRDLWSIASQRQWRNALEDIADHFVPRVKAAN